MSGSRKSLGVVHAGIAAALMGSLAAQTASAEPVDVELILAVDVSLSMSPMELAIQRDGYVAALTHETVLRAIRDGLHGRIAIAYVEWAGSTVQEIVVPWTLVESAEDARAIADRLSVHPPSSARRTSISSMLDFAQDMFAESGFRGMRRVIDISGDGPNNQGGPVTAARDALIEQGITINGLPLMTSGGYSSVYDLAHLDRYYSECVIGGPGAFMIPVNDWDQFAEAVRRKLVLELVDAKPDDGLDRYNIPPVILASAEGAQIDCEIGEKMWGNRSWMWDAR